MSQYNTFTLNSRTQKMWRRDDPANMFRRNQNVAAFRSSKTLGPVAHTVLVALMLAVLGLIYLTQVTKTSTYGYEISDLQDKQTELSARKQDLQVENARLQALERVKESNVAKALERPAVSEYAN